ncbi:DedA family protein [Kineococcus indalonis]|uniref:DedA family protein n=1 Tax=Kineococcus indalonis TaxID=2696566 RepID=UPI001412B016|nr:DedA family protein [Kineococcus indalonis]NAZ86784.1 DedA family protein [Kineococcus indalonis]
MPLLAEISASLPAAAPALLPDWLEATTLLDTLGAAALWGAAAVVFAECGLLIGFFLPGDSLLFTVGLFTHEGHVPHALWLVCLVLSAAALLGNVCGYEIGRAAGPAILDRPNSRIFKRGHVEKTQEFFATYGARAIILARFVPVVRTFITVAAGAGRMPRRTFFTFSAIGAVLWGTGVTVLGYLLGGIAFIRQNIEVGLLVLVAISVLPVVLEVLNARRKQRRAGAALPQQVVRVDEATPENQR